MGGEEQEIGPGEFMMVSDGVEHEARMAEGCGFLEVFALHAYAYTHQAKPLLSIFQDPVGRLDQPESWFTRLRLLTHLLAKTRAPGIAYGEALLRELLMHQVIRGNGLTRQPHPGDARIWNSIQIILNEGHLPLTVSELARRAGLGVVQYRKLFQQAVGQSPKAYLRQTRLTRARALLETDPHMPLKEVADRAGFSDARYLHQVFREQHGTTPGAYRKRQSASAH